MPPKPANYGIGGSASATAGTPTKPPKRKTQPLAGPAAPTKRPPNAGIGGSAGVTAGSVHPSARPTDKPDPVLAQYGYVGSPDTFDERLGQVRSAYKRVKGVEPPAGLAFDVARSTVPPDLFFHLFQPLGLTTAAAKAVGIGRKYAPSLAAPDTEPGLSSAEQRKAEETLRRRAQAAYMHSGVAGPGFVTAARDAAINEAGDLLPENRAAAIFDAEIALRHIKAAASIGGKAVTQVTTALIHSPEGLYVAGRAFGLDVGDLVTEGDVSPERTAAVAHAIGQGVYEDFAHPAENPGFLLLDLFGFFSAGGGTVARGTAAVGRVAEAGRLARAGELVQAAKLTGRAFAKPEPKTSRLAVRGDEGELAVNLLLSENPAVRAVQRLANSRKQKKLDLRRDEGGALGSVGFGAVVRGARAEALLDRFLDPLRANFSLETKVGRELASQERTSLLLDQRLKRELDAAAGWARAASPVFGTLVRRMPARLRNGLTVGEQKAIFSLAVDDADPIGVQRRFHESMIDRGIGDPGAHRAQLAALNLAEKILADPRRQSARFKKALDLTREVVAEMEATKIRDLGLRADTAEGRVAALGEVLRGAEYVEPTPARLGVPSPALIESRARVERLQGEYDSALSRSKAKNAQTRPATRAEAEARLAELEAEHDRLLTEASERLKGGVGFDKAETARRNIERANAKKVAGNRRGREGTPGRGPKTQAQELRTMAEEQLDRLAGQNPGEAWAKAYIAQRDELSQLRAALNETHPVFGERSSVARDLGTTRKYPNRSVYDPTVTRLGAALSVAKDELASREAAAARNVKPTGLVSDGEPVTPQRQTSESFYLPTVSQARSARVPRGMRAPGVRPGPLGIPVPGEMPELTHVFTGDAIRAGDIRLDTTATVGEAYARTVRAASTVNQYRRLWASATDTPRSPFDRPIRDSKTIDPKLREITSRIEQGELTGKEAAQLHPEDIESLTKLLYPGRKAKDGRWVLDEPIPGVKWVDGRLLGYADRVPFVPGVGTKIALAINEPIKAVTLYLRPAYLLNALGSTAMLLLDEGFLKGPANIIRALRADSLYGAENVRTIDALTGSSRTRSYAPDVPGTSITKASSTMAEWWNVITDQAFRRASFIHYARKAGYTTADDLTGLFKDRELRPKVDEIKRRANKAMVEFDNLTWFEQNTLRHLIFVYPWVSRSAVWSLRTIVEHPVKTAVLAHLGEEAQDDPVFKNAVEWVKKRGYVPVGWTADGKPRIVDPTSINTFSTLGDVVGTAVGGRYQSAEDLAGPAVKFFIHGTTGRDEYGNEYPGNDWVNSALDVLGAIPQARARARSEKENPPAEQADLSSRRALIAQEHDALKRTVFDPGWLDGYGSLLVGGLSPRGYDKAASVARYWRDQPIEARLKHEQTLIRAALNLQGELLKRPVPAEVKQAVEIAGGLDLAAARFAAENGRTPTAKEKVGILIDELADAYRLSDDDTDTLRKKLGPLTLENEIANFRRAILNDFGDGRELAQWDADVRAVWSFRKPILTRKLQLLKAQGLIDDPSLPGSQETLFEYGRRVVAYSAGVKERFSAAIKVAGSEARNAAFAELRAWQDEHDHPVKVNGHLFPSPVALDWANQTPREQQEALRQNATLPWEFLSRFEKKMLGRPAAPEASKGWAKFVELKADAARQLRPGSHFPPGYLDTLARYTDRYYGRGFFKDYLVSKEPLVQRLLLGGLEPAKMVAPLENSPNAETWRQVLAPAAQYAKLLRDPDYSKSQVHAAWKRYVESTLLPWAQSRPGFGRELASYDPDLLYNLLG